MSLILIAESARTVIYRSPHLGNTGSYRILTFLVSDRGLVPFVVLLGLGWLAGLLWF